MNIAQVTTLFSRKAPIIQAEKVLREAQNIYGRTHSATYLTLKSLQHQDQNKYASVISRMRPKVEQYAEDIFFRNYATAAYKEGRNLPGDCGECAKAIQKRFLKEGTPAINVVMEITQKGENLKSNHMFTLSNISPDADIAKPRTWGKDSVITDLWGGFAKKTQDALGYLQNLFKVNPDVQKVEYKLAPTDILSSELFGHITSQKNFLA